MMMDSPGILMPAYKQKELSSNLAFTNNIKLTVVPIEEVAYELLNTLKNKNLDYLNKALKTEYTIEKETQDIMDELAIKRGNTKLGIIDYSNISFQVVKNFADGKMGKITLEKYDD
jgi:ribosome biogenesis GTPase A